jgi:hypothetical protein
MNVKPKLRFKPGMPAICWGRPDSPPRDLCAVCHGALPETSLQLWRKDGASAAFCDDCVEKWFEL